MSDTPSPTPESTPEPALKPKLTLTPKAPAPAPEAAAPAPAPAPASTLQASSSGTPPSLTASNTGAPRASLKLQGPGSAKIETVNAPTFQSPMPMAADDRPSIAVVALSFIAAAAAITFAVLLYFKNQ